MQALFLLEKMTIKQARKILGQLADDISDQKLEQEIETASLLKDIFFSVYLRGRRQNKIVNNLRSFTNGVQSQ